MTEDHAARRDTLATQIADRLLDAGCAQIALRELALALGTSDRMLLYYFETKSALVEASLAVVAARLAAVLDGAVPAGRYPPATMLRVTLVLLRSEPLAPAMRVWTDLAARGGRGEAPFDAIAVGMTARWLDWIEARLDTPEAGRRDAAAALLAVVEGARQVGRLAPGAVDRVEEALAAAFA